MQTRKIQKQLKYKHGLCVAVLAALMALTGCEITGIPVDSQSQANETQENGQQGNTTTTPISVDELPEYSGEGYVVVNDNVPYFSQDELTTDVFETYSDLDPLGRCGVAYANICEELMPTEPRGDIYEIRPSGWKSVRYNNVEGESLYNRSHLIAFSLAGENANEKNLITGTRYMNADVMQPFENMVGDYVRETNNHVLYRVTPIFEGDNLVASGVLMEAESVEDNGAGIEYCVYCYNVQPGIGIDYATGASWLLDENGEEQVETYILNTGTKKFHKPECDGAKEMNPKNRQEFTGKRSELLKQGYEPCHTCNP